MELRVVDGAVALQPADGAAAALEPATRLRLGVLQAGLPALHASGSGSRDMEFSKLLPSIFLPTYLKHTLGYRTHARVSMPVLNPFTAINRDFDSYELMPTHNDMAAIVDQLSFDEERPSFWLLNVGETHYPYALPGQDSSDLPHISGVHGVFKQLGATTRRRRREAGRVLRPSAAEGAARAPGRGARVPRRRVRDAARAAPGRHLADRHLRPRRAVRRGRLLRARADRAREGARGAVRRRSRRTEPPIASATCSRAASSGARSPRAPPRSARPRRLRGAADASQRGVLERRHQVVEAAVRRPADRAAPARPGSRSRS